MSLPLQLGAPSRAGLMPGTLEYRSARAAYKRWQHDKHPELRQERVANVTNRQRGLKAELIALFGGACHRCGYNEHPAALAFHHKDPSKKTTSFGGGNLRAKFTDSQWKELAGCELLCFNCHQVEHAGY